MNEFIFPTYLYNFVYFVNVGLKVGVLENQSIYGPDVNGVRYMTIYGIKGLSAYACHANALGEEDPEVATSLYEVYRPIKTEHMLNVIL